MGLSVVEVVEVAVRVPLAIAGKCSPATLGHVHLECITLVPIRAVDAILGAGHETLQLLARQHTEQTVIIQQAQQVQQVSQGPGRWVPPVRRLGMLAALVVRPVITTKVRVK